MSPVLAPPHYRQEAMALGGDVPFQASPCSPGPQNQGSSVQRGLCLLDAPAGPKPEWLLQEPRCSEAWGRAAPGPWAPTLGRGQGLLGHRCHKTHVVWSLTAVVGGGDPVTLCAG